MKPRPVLSFDDPSLLADRPDGVEESHPDARAYDGKSAVLGIRIGDEHVVSRHHTYDQHDQQCRSEIHPLLVIKVDPEAAL